MTRSSAESKLVQPAALAPLSKPEPPDYDRGSCRVGGHCAGHVGPAFMNLSRLQMQYSDLVGRTATKLRLTPQSRHAASDSKRANKEPA